jgi:hypothetical protein
MRTWPGTGGHTSPLTMPSYTGPTRKEWEDFKDLIQKALEIDKKTGQPDCIDPKKAEWMKKMEELYDNAKNPKLP